MDDERFSRLATDPRFRRLPKQERKTKVDSRFDRLFTDPAYAHVANPKFDRYGRRTPHAPQQHAHDFERTDDAASDGEPTPHQPSSVYVSSAAAASERRQTKVSKRAATKAAAKAAAKPCKSATARKEREEMEARRRVEQAAEDERRMREGYSSGDTTEASTTEDEGSDAEVDDESGGGEQASALLGWVTQVETVPRVKDATRRLAVVNLNWDQVRAVDVLAVLRSFEPSGGRVLSVAIYLSDFGAERMAFEQKHGPALGGVGGGNTAVDDEAALDEAALNERLREYELSRFKYYYAVATCDTSATADHIYGECDGAEFEASAMVLDLRFIPDDMSFARKPRDEASEMPAKYTSPVFSCAPLQQSTVKLSWDADDETRTRVLKRDFTKSELHEMDYKSYIASESDSSGEEEYAFTDAPAPPSRSGVAKLRALGRSAAPEVGGVASDDEEGVDREMSFVPRTKERAAHVGADSAPHETSVWAEQQRKRKQKLQEKRRLREPLAADASEPCGVGGFNADEDAATAADDDDDLLVDDVPFADDPFGADDGDGSDVDVGRVRHPKRTSAEADAAGSGGKRRKRDKKKKRKDAEQTPEEAAEAARQEAELRLLIDEEDGARGYDVKELVTKKAKRKEKRQLERRMKVAKEVDTQEAAEGFSINVDDPRFQKLFASADYAIDPSSSKFLRTEATQKILSEITKRHTLDESVRALASAESLKPDLGSANKDESLARLVSAAKSRGAKAESSGKARREKKTK